MSHLAGFGERQGAGRRPALLVIDMSLGFTSPDSPLVCDLHGVVEAIRRLLEAARAKGLPVVFTTVSYGEGEKAVAKAFIDKVPILLTLAEGSRFTEIDPRIAPRPEEPVLNKLFASAFFGTSFQSLLAAHDCDSVIVTGASTSGCVRATAVDVLQNGYRLMIPREAVGDRNEAAHDQALYDVDAKYGDVVSLDEALAVIEAAE
ncbi:MAG: maleamate amidohydrolase [Gaiellaceae bacterium]|nr:maleamate amidohydrolase [Gaiellaceae bacterium]